MEVANLSVSITGDTSGLLSALGEAQNALAKFDSKTLTPGSSLSYYTLGVRNQWFDSEKKLLEHYKKTNNMSYKEELEWWNRLLEMFSYDSEAVLEIREGIYAAQQSILKSQKAADKSALSEYKKSSDSWIKYQTEVNDMSVQDQIDAYSRQLYNYNAMVSEMVSSTLYSTAEIKEIWADFYDYKADVDLKIGKLENEKRYEQYEKNYAVYEKWKSDAKNWKLIRDTYDDWYETGDSPVKFYERSIAKIQEMYDGGYVGWQEYRDDTMMAKLNLYKAKMEQIDELLSRQKNYINDLKEQFSAEEAELSESWEVSDRKAEKAEISQQLKIYKNAVTQKGIDKYNSLQEQMKKLNREEQMYELQKSNAETIAELEESYDAVEANKKYLLATIEKTGVNIEGIVGSVNYDIKSMENTVTSLFAQTISAIKSIKVSSNSYSDNRNISISSNASSVIEALKNRVGLVIAHGSYN